MDDILRYTISNRIRIVKETANSEYIYQILSSHLKLSIDVLKNMYNIQVKPIRDELVISSDSTDDMCRLFLYTQSFGMNCVSIESKCLRIIIHEFLTKIR